VREAFVETLVNLAEGDERIWLVTGDLGYSLLEPFAERFPDRFVNVGVAEQNMIGVAAGLALSGKVVFTYSIANFLVLRCLEQVRNDICYHDLSVKMVAVGAGLAYGPAGYTHHCVEDLSVMLAMPNVTVIVPADPVETRLATRAIADMPGPCLLRLGKSREPVIHRIEPKFEVGKAIIVREGADVTLMSTGRMLRVALEAAEILASENISARVLSVHTVRPLDEEAIIESFRRTKRVVVIEEHSARGGFADAVGQLLLDRVLAGKSIRKLALRPEALSEVGSAEHLLSSQGLDPVSIASVVKDQLSKGL
jgi:transketolase